MGRARREKTKLECALECKRTHRVRDRGEGSCSRSGSETVLSTAGRPGAGMWTRRREYAAGGHSEPVTATSTGLCPQLRHRYLHERVLVRAGGEVTGRRSTSRFAQSRTFKLPFLAEARSRPERHEAAMQSSYGLHVRERHHAAKRSKFEPQNYRVCPSNPAPVWTCASLEEGTGIARTV